MPRDLPLGNGSLLMNFDARYDLRDIYFPHVGQENHAPDHPSRFGVWTPGGFAWLADDGWQRSAEYETDTLVTRVQATHPRLQVALTLRDTVDYELDVFVRRVEVRNLASHLQQVRLFFHLDPHVYGIAEGDTAYYHPEYRCLIAYKGRRYLWLCGMVEGEPLPGLHAFTTGVKEFRGLEGTWRDAEDGHLHGNPIAQGSVDCTGSLAIDVPPGETRVCWFWLALGRTFGEVSRLHLKVVEVGPGRLLERTRAFWRLWLEGAATHFADAPEDLARFAARSLLIIRTNCDNEGAILAANDGEILKFARDTYSYMWPRDGALVAIALDQVGLGDLTSRFFGFCSRVIGRQGYFLHKYNPDGSLASTWHPWLDSRGRPQLPIQEDETGLVLHALWQHFQRWRDAEVVRGLYSGLVVPAAEFMVKYRDGSTGLPLPSYDLWEERRGVHAWTAAAVWAGLRAAAGFARGLGEPTRAARYARAAEEVRLAVARHLYDPGLGRFVRTAYPVEADAPAPVLTTTAATGSELPESEAVYHPPIVGYELDPTVDSSLYGLFAFGMFPPDDPRIVATMKAVADRLWVPGPIGGIARYEGDWYQRDGSAGQVPGNPWFICTLWLAQWYIATARTVEDLEPAERLLRWTVARAPASGVLAEQVHPVDGRPLSVAPLTWSHATFVETLSLFAARRRALAGQSSGVASAPATA